MHRRSPHRLTFLSLVAFALLAPGVAQAQPQDYSVLIDSDNSDATGCTVGTPPEAFLGADFRVVTTVNTTVDPPVVTNIDLEVCTAPPSTWSPFAGPDPFTEFPTPFPAPTDGIYDAIESYVPLVILASGPVLQVGFFSGPITDPQDVLFTTNGAPGGPAIQFGVPVVTIPTLAEWSMLLLALLLLTTGIVALRRRASRAGLMLGLLLISGGLGVAIASSPHAADGNILDWTGHLPIASDALPPDAGANADIFRAFAHFEGHNVFFRHDANNTPNAPPQAVDDTATVAEDSGPTTIDVLANDTDPPPADVFTIGSVTQPANGTVVITNGGADLTYQPDADYCNSPPGTSLDTFTYTLTPAPSTATVTVTVTCVDDPPTAVDDAATVAEDAAATTIDVQANDIDPDGGANTISSVTQPANGTVVITNAGADLTYQPDAAYCNTPPGTTLDTFTYTLSPGGSSATVTVTVTCDDDAATAVDDAATVAEDAPATTIDVQANDTDPDGGTNTISAVTQPANGAVVITNAGADLTYQPNADYCNDPPGTTLDTFTYTLSPGGSTATVSVTVTCADDNPVANDDTATVAEDAAATPVDVLANDTDAESDPFTIQSVTQPANGTVVITNAGADLTYQPNADYCNSPPGTTLDTFTYTLTPGGDSATVSVTVTCSDDDPVAVDDAATVAEDAAATSIDVLANDTDIDGGPKTIASATDPANGTVVVAGDGLSLTYQPDPDYCNSPPGTTLDTFDYTLAPGGDTATVSMTVTCFDDPPVAVNDAATVNEDSGANTVNVLANDTDSDGGPIAVTSVTQPANGTVVITNAGADLTYAPNADYCNNPPGTTLDTFTYTLTPGGSIATVTVTVTCVNDGPAIDLDADDDKGTAGTDFAVTFTEGDPATLLEDPVDATLTDIDSSTVASLTVTLTNILDPTFEVLDADISAFVGTLTKVYDTTTTPGTGVLTISGTESAANYETVLRTVTYLNSDTAPDSTARTVTFVANDGTDDGNTATSTVTVVGQDTDPTAVDDSATVNEDSGAGTIDVLGNDTDPDGGPISITSVTQPANGTVVITNAGADLTYAPNANYCNNPPGTTLDTFTYTLTPGGDSATVTVTVTCIDDTPTAVDDSATVVEDSGATTIDVQANDTDADGGTNTITSVTQPANGTVVITNAGADLTYAPNANYCNSPPGTTLDTFTYTLTPGGDTATVTVTVTCVEDNPVAVDDAATVVEDSGATTVNVQANDTDADGGTNTITSVTQPANGTVVITNAGADLTYAPNANYCNSPPGTTLDTFTYTLTPGGDTGTVTVTVTCVDDPPTAVNDAATVDEDSGANTINVQANDTDVDGGTNTITSVTQPANGTVAITNAGADLTYTPNLNYCNNPPGTTLESFTYTLTPGGSFATVTVTVTCINDPPVLTDTTPNYTAIGNTQLRAGATPPVVAAVAFSTDASGVLANGKAGPITDVDGPGPIQVVPATGASANGGTFTIEADGDFTYHPPVGFTGTDTFVVQVSDSGTPAAFANATVTVAVAEMVWYVQNNTATAGNAGTSVDPFNTLVEAETASGVNHFIYVLEGDGNSTGQNAGITLKDGQKFLGKGVDLLVSGHTLISGNMANLPLVTDTNDTVTVLANTANGNRVGVQIRGFELSSTGGNAIDVTSANAADLGVEIANNLISGATAEGIDVNVGSTNTSQELSLHDNTVTSNGNGIDIARTAGTLTITAFDDNQVSGNANATGILVTGPVTFDATPGGSLDTVSGGSTLVGASGNPVTGAGMSMSQVTGALSFTNLDIFAGTSGLFFQGTGAFTGAAGASFSVTPAPPDGSGTSTIDADNGAAVDVASATIDLRLDDLDSTTAGGGLALSSVAGQLKTDSDASIVKSSGGGTAFSVANSSASVNYGGTLNVTSGSGVGLSNNTGAVNFSGKLTLSTGSNAAFSATGASGTVTATHADNTLTTTNATALNVNGPDIGVGGLNFDTISSNGAASGIILQDTGSTAGLTVSGNGGVCTVATPTCTGGTIQSSTGAGINLINTSAVNLSLMRITGGGDDGIRGSNVTGFTLGNSLVTSNGNALNENGLDFSGLLGTATISASTIRQSFNNNAVIRNSTGTLTLLTVTGSTFSNNVSNTDGDGLLFEAAGTANMSANISGSTFSAHHSDHFQAAALNSGVLNVTFSTNTLSGGHAAPLGQGITINAATGAPGFAGSVTYDLNGNTINGAISNAIMANLGTSSGAATFKGQIRNNIIGTSGSALSCSTQANGINVEAHGNGTHTSSVTGNTIRRCFDRGINVLANDGNGAMNLTVTNNTVAEMSDTDAILGTPREAFLLVAGSTSTNVFGQIDSHAVCLGLSGPSGSLIGGAFKNGDIRTRQRFRTSVRLPGYAGTAFDTTAVVNFLQGNNPGSTATATASDDGAVATDGYFGGAACPLP